MLQTVFIKENLETVIAGLQKKNFKNAAEQVAHVLEAG